jgi:hypothetical protein
VPNCFSLTRKGETEPMKLVKVDEAICQHFGWTPHMYRWAYNWYNIIGFEIACGKRLGSQELRDWVADMPDSPEALLCILDFLEREFTDNAWVEIGRGR